MHITIPKLTLAIAAAILAGTAMQARAADLHAKRDAIPGQYIVVLKPEAAALRGESSAAEVIGNVAKGMAEQHGAKVTHTYQQALRGFAARADSQALKRILADPRVAYVEQDAVVRGNPTQTNATWGLDRVDQRGSSLNASYIFDQTGSGVRAYVIDSGLRTTHSQFAGRVAAGASAINDGRGVTDCHGHGTHVSGTIAGTTWGVAKNVTIHPVRVLDCNNSGTTSGVIAGIDWVRVNHIKPAVANMSLGGGASDALDAAVNNLINSGVAAVVSAGNANGDACAQSPARVPRAITVASIDSNGARSSFSNYGKCVDLFAPGGSITSAWLSGDSASAVLSGTSMAAPHVTGVAALFLQLNPQAAPVDVTFAVVGKATMGVVGNAGPGSPNHLLFSRLSTTARAAWFRYYTGVGHFYTMNWNEVGAANFPGWAYEGVAGYMRSSSASGTTAMYRYYNTRFNQHFYTSNPAELGAGGFDGWVYEGISGYVPTTASASTAPLYRYANSINNAHFYTTNFSELGNGGTYGWVYEGVQSQIWTQP
jgi:serine protease